MLCQDNQEIFIKLESVGRNSPLSKAGTNIQSGGLTKHLMCGTNVLGTNILCGGLTQKPGIKLNEGTNNSTNWTHKQLVRERVLLE